MKKFFLSLFLVIALFIRFQTSSIVNAQTETPIICGCPSEISSIYQERQTGEECVIATDDSETAAKVAFEKFKSKPAKYHLWVEDAEITAQGKADDRARQFIYWVLTHGSIDNHPVILKIWSTARNLAYFFVILIAAIMGIGMIVNQRNNFSTSIKIWPSIMKILVMLLYISFSATIVIAIIQLSEVMMKFFSENLGGKDLFNIYFSGVSKESGYLDFVGCRDLNIRVQEAFKAEMVLLKITNITYYVMGGMLLLRKILLWFLLFVSPFLALLMPFVFIRNIGWIWIGVFFQWIFYGPLFALFLGALAAIWKAGIPFVFDFSRARTTAGYIFPTVINVLYSGPHDIQRILNNGNYVDTFSEYIITLIMLWAVIFFPWWLLRIFRDYCCDGINAMKNILMSMHDQNRSTPPTPPGPAPTPTTIGTALKIPREIEIPVRMRLETIEEIKKTKTEDITRSLSVSASHLTDVANFETNKQTNETVKKNLNFLQNPTRAETVRERQKYMNIKTELYNRSTKNDQVAKTVLSSISTSHIEQQQVREGILKTMPHMVPVVHVVSIRANVPMETVRSVTNSLATNTNVVNDIAQKTKLQTSQVKMVLSSLHQNIDQSPAQITQKVAEQSGVKKEEVIKIIENLPQSVKERKELVQTVAEYITQPEKNIEQTVSMPPSVSIEEYEQVKKMWTHQYEKGEVPVTENIKTRDVWVDQDIVIITNTINKLLSSQEETRQQGLDDVGYILPIFLVNNLTGEQLLVYLKAKIEAAKTVKDLLGREKEVIERLKVKPEETIDVLKPKKKEAEKTMELKQELDEVKS